MAARLRPGPPTIFQPHACLSQPVFIWKILHERMRNEERGPAVTEQAMAIRTHKMIRELRTLGYRVQLVNPMPKQRLNDFRPWLIQAA